MHLAPQRHSVIDYFTTRPNPATNDARTGPVHSAHLARFQCATDIHPEKIVRQHALEYFEGCSSRDPEVMPLAIQAIEIYGAYEAFDSIYSLRNLLQTEATVDWLIKALNSEEDEAFPFWGYHSALSQVLCDADPQLLIPRASEITDAIHIDRLSLYGLQEWIDLESWDVERCWSELERMCAESVKSVEFDFDFERADRLARTIARKGGPEERVLELLGREVGDPETDPMYWMESYLIEMAGEMRLRRAIPDLVRKLRKANEFLAEDGIEALGKIGTDIAVEELTRNFADQVWEVRTDTAIALQVIHTDSAITRSLELLAQEEDAEVQDWLAQAILAQFAEEGIEPACQLIRKKSNEWDSDNLKKRLVAVGTVLGPTFPEFEAWKEELELKDRQLEKWNGPADSNQTSSTPTLADDEPFHSTPQSKMTPFVRTEKQVGRNDPCPCGSGKKFKKCCMGK